MKAVILCGGKGTRLREETEYKPKPMVLVGDKPILWHIMKLYSHYGVNDFVLCLGYKGEMIKDYFTENAMPEWNITFADTGLECHTGGRIAKIKKYLEMEDDENFFLTYGDGVANVDIKKLLDFHISKNKIATITGVKPVSPWGVLEIQSGLVKSFVEKPKTDNWINGGFFVCNRRIFDYLPLDDDCVFEQEPLRSLSAKDELAVYCHDDFWKCVDTFKDLTGLSQLYDKGERRWMVWES